MKVLDFPFGTFEFHDKYIISEISEGVQVQSEHIEQVIKQIKGHYKGRPVGYISRRVNAISVNPMAYMEYPPYEFTGVVAFAIVIYRTISAECAEVEKRICSHGGKVAMELFDDFDTAERWVAQYVDQIRAGKAS